MMQTKVSRVLCEGRQAKKKQKENYLLNAGTFNFFRDGTPFLYINRQEMTAKCC